MTGIQELFDLTGKVAIVTGGAGFLGQQFSEALVEAGASVVVADLDQQVAIEYAGTLKGNTAGIALDVTKPDSVNRCINETLNLYGSLDILINSAALDPKFESDSKTSHVTSFEEFPLTAWKDALDVNLTGMFLTCQAAAKVMKR